MLKKGEISANRVSISTFIPLNLCLQKKNSTIPKSFGTTNKIACSRATILALKELKETPFTKKTRIEKPKPTETTQEKPGDKKPEDKKPETQPPKETNK